MTNPELQEVKLVLMKIKNKDNLVMRALAYVEKDLALRFAQALRGKSSNENYDMFGY